MDRGAVIGQLGVRVALALVDGRHHGDSYLCSGEVVEECSGDGVVGLLRGVRIAAEAQGPVVVGQGDAQGARGVEVADLVRTGQQVAGHVPQPGGGVDQVGGPTEHGDLRQNAVDGGLQGELQRVEVSCRGEGPGVLQGQYLRVVAIQPGVPQGQRGVHRGLLDEGQQGRCDDPMSWLTSAGVVLRFTAAVRTYVGGVLGACLQGRVLGEDEAELPGGDALQLDDRGLGDAVIEDPPGEGGREQ